MSCATLDNISTQPEQQFLFVPPDVMGVSGQIAWERWAIEYCLKPMLRIILARERYARP